MPFNFRYIYIILVAVIFSCVKSPNTPSGSRSLSSTISQTQEPVIVSLEGQGLNRNDVITSLENTISLDSGTNNDIVRELIQRKLFIAEARSMGMDTTENFREQIQSHTQLALQGILEDKNAITMLGNEAYERYQKEVNASHIFIPLSSYASAADTLKLYKELLNIRDLALKNNDFDVQAKRWSKDPKTASNGGSLGWFSVFNLVYPLETAVYNTPKDSISRPIRTKSGYHLIKVNDSRKNNGTVKVQHIFKYVANNTPPAQINTLFNLLDSVKNEIEKGARFEDMVTRFSDDFNTRDSGGELLPFGIGTRTEAAFEEVAFALKKGEISKPVQSSSGLHLIRLIEKYKPETKAKFLEINQSKLTTDSRAEFLQSKRIQTLKRQYNPDIRKDVLDNAMRFASVRILTRNWVKPSTIILTDPLLIINEKTYTVGQFFQYIEERQEFEKWPSENPTEIFSMLFENFLNAKLLNYQEETVVKQNPDVKRWINAQEENILYSNFSDQFILEKTMRDTLALRSFYEKNKNLFTPNELGNMSVMSFADEDTYKKFKELAAAPKPYKLFRGITPILYTQNAYTLDPAEERKLRGLITILDRTPGYIVEIGGHSDAKEEDQISELRIKEVVNFLVKNGVPLKRILEVNYKSSVVHDRFDWSRNQTVTFQFFSNLESDLAVTFNSKNEDAITFDAFRISKKDFESKMKTTWGNKTGTFRNDGRVEEYTLKVRKTRGTYQDYKSEVIARYQDQLRADLEKKLAEKFKLNYNPAEINSIINDLKKNK